jgi:hypothetical protein
MRRLLLTLALILALPVAAHAFTCTATGCTFTISYTEPTTNTAGGPPQLTSTTAFYTGSGGTEKSVTTPASSANGGQLITKTITEPILPGQSVTITGGAFATNPAGNSARANAGPLAINRAGEVVDNAPTGVTIQ